MATIYQLNEWPVVATNLYEEYANGLADVLCRRFPRTDPQLVCDSVLGALLDIALKIDQVEDPEDLHGLLYVAAFRKLRCSVRSEAARRARETKKQAESVARSESAHREQWEALGDAEMLDRIFTRVPETDEERVVLEHWGESFQEVATALHWDGLPETEQRKKVKTIRDRLGKRLDRFLEDTNA